MIEVTMKFESMTAAAAFFNAHSVGVNTTGSDAHIIETLAPTADAVEVVKDKKPRAKKETAPAVAAAKPVAPVPETETGTNTATLDDVRTAVGKFIAETDFATGTALVQKFMKADGTPATRMTEIQEKDYAAIIAATQEAA